MEDRKNMMISQNREWESEVLTDVDSESDGPGFEPRLLLNSCVTIGKWSYLSELQYPCL